jgi:hypothetical protein
MEIELKNIDLSATVLDIYEAVEKVLHGPGFYDPNDRRNNGRKPNFEVIPGTSPAGRIHDGTAILRVPYPVGGRLFRWFWASPEHKIVVKRRALRLFNTYHEVTPGVEYKLERAPYIDPHQEKLREELEEKARQVRLRIAKVQFGVWYTQSDSAKHGRTFSVEHERDYVTQSAAYLNIIYERSLICIDVSATFLGFGCN